MELDELRQEIDTIDKELLSLFVRRMETVDHVAQYKLGRRLAIFNEEREAQILAQVEQDAGESFAAGARTLFTALMDISKTYQHRILSAHGAKNDLCRLLEESSAQSKQVPLAAEVACQGIAGAYSHQATQSVFALSNVHFYSSFSDVFDAVTSGACAFGVLPIDNSSAGSVREIYDLLHRHHLYICKSCKLPISHCLLTLGEVPLEQITDVYSHEQALSQCAAFLRGYPAMRTHVFSNTAAAAQHVKNLGVPTAAAIASSACAQLYSLKIARRRIQDSPINRTRFIVISQELIIPPEADKISLCLSLPNSKGALSRILTRFTLNNLNLLKLESRPIPDSDFEFLFYFDFEGSVREENVRVLLGALSEEVSRFDFLGNYR